MAISLKKLFSRKPAFSRSAARYACQLDSVLVSLDRMLSFEGRVIDLSCGGAMFRPKLAYLMSRRDEPICLQVGNLEIFGRLMSTSPSGFGLRFDEPVEEADILALLENQLIAPKGTTAPAVVS